MHQLIKKILLSPLEFLSIVGSIYSYLLGILNNNYKFYRNNS